MALTVDHAKTNNIADWTQAELDAQIALGNYPAGTLLADIVLPSDWNGTHDVTGTLPSDDITAPTCGDATYTTLTEFMNISTSGGIVSGGVITDAGGGSVDISAATLLVRSTNSDVGELCSADFAGTTGQALTDNSVNYVYLTYSMGGDATVTVSTTPLADVYRNIIAGIVYREGTRVHITNVNTPPQQVSQVLGKRLAFVDGLTRQSGGVLSETGVLNIAITAGLWWLALIEYNTPASDTSVSDTFTYYYRDGVGGFTEMAGETDIDNLQYDDGSGTLATLGNSKYGVHWVYQGLDGDKYVVYGYESYNLNDAEESPVPSSLPPQITQFHAALLGKIIVQKSAVVFTEIQSPFDTIFSSGVASNHGDLAGLTDDDHTQYTLADGTRPFTGTVYLSEGTSTASASILTLPTDGNTIPITGTTTITRITNDFQDGTEVTLRFANPLDLTGNAVTFFITTGTLVGNGTVNIRAGDSAVFVRDGTFISTPIWKLKAVHRADYREEPFNTSGADLASASTLAVNKNENSYTVTGSTTIVALAYTIVGSQVTLKFDSALTISYNAVLFDNFPNNASISVDADDVLVFRQITDAIGTVPYWQLLSWRKKDGSLAGYAPKQTYTITNDTTDRTFNANGTSVAELADVLATLLKDLETAGILTTA